MTGSGYGDFLIELVGGEAPNGFGQIVKITLLLIYRNFLWITQSPPFGNSPATWRWTLRVSEFHVLPRPRGDIQQFNP